MELTTLPLLADLADVAARTGVAYDADNDRALAMLAEASAFFRSYTGQQITLVEDDTQELFGTWDDVLQLPQLPVSELSDLSLRYRGETSLTVYDDWTFTRRGRVRRVGGWGGPDAIVSVTYTHGFETVPDDVRRCVASIAHRIMANPNDVIGEQIGSYQVTYAQQALTDRNPIGLTVRDQVVMDKYREWASH